MHNNIMTLRVPKDMPPSIRDGLMKTLRLHAPKYLVIEIQDTQPRSISLDDVFTVLITVGTAASAVNTTVQLAEKLKEIAEKLNKWREKASASGVKSLGTLEHKDSTLDLAKATNEELLTFLLTVAQTEPNKPTGE